MILVGITLDSGVGGYASFPWYALRQNYAHVLGDLKVVPVFLPYCKNSIQEYCDLLDGLVLTGGDFDIDPSYYTKDVFHPKTSLNLERTEFEYALLEKFYPTSKPILGICGGMQLINVYKGGTLHQHIPDSYPNSLINHTQPHPKNEPSHLIKISSSSKLFSFGFEEAYVNSTHHQSVDKLGKDILLSAKSPDEVVEAIEDTCHPFCIGVQWHPEYLKSKVDLPLYNAFKEECYRAKNSITPRSRSLGSSRSSFNVV
ncbi:MAG TPA: gamma-glutamyl-gamma-aminobutyrate hydrolase family protein [Alphaproteobacteria bacterium]|nr:gamma-glutamyl-gamma-aminobutyrate hydrolase family protein [Alphaproteobacteria bacterium]